MEEASSWETQEDGHPSTLISIINMSELPERMGKLEDARPLYEEDLQAKRETLGDRHPDTLISIGKMGNLLHAMGKLDEARPLYERLTSTRPARSRTMLSCPCEV